VLLNGETIGTLTEDPQSPGSPLDILVDTTATHCFNLEWHMYSTFPDDPVPMQSSGEKTLRPQRLRTLTDYVDYFLQPLPDEIESETDLTSKTALNEIPCR
jgi:hypothetical protein